MPNLTTKNRKNAFELAKDQLYLVWYQSQDKDKTLYNTWYNWCKDNDKPFIVIGPMPRSKKYVKVSADTFPVFWASKKEMAPDKIREFVNKCDEQWVEKCKKIIREYMNFIQINSRYHLGMFTSAIVEKKYAIKLAKEFLGAFSEIKYPNLFGCDDESCCDRSLQN